MRWVIEDRLAAQLLSGTPATTLALHLLEPVGPSALDALRRDAMDVLRFLDLPPGTDVAVVV